jgi:ubiquinone biosynthesis protein COQ4
MHSLSRRTITSAVASTLSRNARPRFSRNAGYARSINTPPAYEGHIPVNWFENAFLAVGSAVMSLVDPRRGGAEFDL